ncbi:hypothetical protein PsorP6_013933 [Peronosclerospora sorghi]|uniref:Uncharacterized protein n=1 Tax=Peronosclerospora sorghi TaxID=230839 RepID=A0ACC0VFY1_9STRA|nr:hypothetical protein PsorP6_013933 [Peronosclerospora sorghi]
MCFVLEFLVSLFGSFYAAMASSLLGDEYASTSSSDNEENTKVAHTYIKESSAVSTTSSILQLLPSADELLSNDTNSVVSTSDAIAYVPTNKRKKEQQVSNQSTKVLKSETGEAFRRWKKMTPFTPPQLLRPNISTEDRSSWNTSKTLSLQKKAQDAKKLEKQVASSFNHMS